MMRGARISYLIEEAYDIDEFQIVGLPEWARSMRFDILAQTDSLLTAKERAQLSWQDLKALKETRLQSLLSERLGFQAHLQSIQAKGYALVAPYQHKIKLKPAGEDTGSFIGSSAFTCSNTSMGGLAQMLAERTGLPIEDKTGLKGGYAFKLKWSPEDDTASPETPGLFTAIQDQLGLKLVPAKTRTTELHIDRIQAPDAN